MPLTLIATLPMSHVPQLATKTDVMQPSFCVFLVFQWIFSCSFCAVSNSASDCLERFVNITEMTYYNVELLEKTLLTHSRSKTYSMSCRWRTRGVQKITQLRQFFWESDDPLKETDLKIGFDMIHRDADSRVLVRYSLPLMTINQSINGNFLTWLK